MNYTKKEEKSSFDKSKLALKHLKSKLEKPKKSDALPKNKESVLKQILNFIRSLYEKIFKQNSSGS